MKIPTTLCVPVYKVFSYIHIVLSLNNQCWRYQGGTQPEACALHRAGWEPQRRLGLIPQPAVTILPT